MKTMPNAIPVHPVFGPMPVTPCPATPGAEEKVSDLYNAQKAITLAKSPAVLSALKANPVPRGKTYE
jgi:hypothetical protein